MNAVDRRFFWSHPEWWCVGASALAWAAMIAHGLSNWGTAHCARMTARQQGLHWLLMVAAMMLPFTLGSVRHVAFRSLRSRRHRAMTAFLVGYFTPWALLGCVAIGLRELAWAHGRQAAALAFAVAALWAALPMRKRAIVACHRTSPLAPLGWRADFDCARFGAFVGSACVTSCWAMMLACAVAGHGLPAMAGGAAIAAFERLSFRPPGRAVAFATLALALGLGVAATRGFM